MSFSILDKVYLPEYSNYSIPYLDVSTYIFEERVIKLISKELALDCCAIPLDLVGNILTVATAKPTIETINILEKATNKIVRIVIANEGQLLFNINQFYKRK
jgi:hypothetical protein